MKEELTVNMVPRVMWKGGAREEIHFVEMLGMRYVQVGRSGEQLKKKMKKLGTDTSLDAEWRALYAKVKAVLRVDEASHMERLRERKSRELNSGRSEWFPWMASRRMASSSGHDCSIREKSISCITTKAEEMKLSRWKG